MISGRYCGMRSIKEIARDIKKDIRANPDAFSTCLVCDGLGVVDVNGG